MRPGSEAFDIQVCTPAWLKSQCAGEGPIWGRHMLIVDVYDYEAIKGLIESYVARIDDDWATIAMTLSRIGAWEFEDYKTR